MKASMKKDEVERERTSMTITINAAWLLALRVDLQGAEIEKESSTHSTTLQSTNSRGEPLHFGSVSLNKTEFYSAWAALLRRV